MPHCKNSPSHLLRNRRQLHHQRGLLPKNKVILVQPILPVVKQLHVEMEYDTSKHEPHFMVRETSGKGSAHSRLRWRLSDSLLSQTVARAVRERIDDLFGIRSVLLLSFGEPALGHVGIRIFEVGRRVVCRVVGEGNRGLYIRAVSLAHRNLTRRGLTYPTSDPSSRNVGSIFGRRPRQAHSNRRVHP